MHVKVENMRSSYGNPIANQFIIKVNGDTYFQSYQTIIAVKLRDGRIKLDRNMWDYSRTTGKYRNIFLGESKAETQFKIDRNIYELDNLNDDIPNGISIELPHPELRPIFWEIRDGDQSIELPNLEPSQGRSGVVGITGVTDGITGQSRITNVEYKYDWKNINTEI